MFDASRPPQTAYPGCVAVGLYIGGNTPHIATSEEWQRFGDLAQFPYWVGYQEEDPIQHGNACVDSMRALGWEQHALFRRAVIVDEETEVNAAWIDAFAGVVWEAGYETFVYGSLYYVMKNPAKEGYLVADWDDIPQLPNYPDIIGCQYQADIEWQGTEIDLSVVTPEMLSHAGYGPRK